jgi:hypothetical protein
MAPRKRNKQDELNRTYRNADVGRVGQSLRNQGYSQSKKGNTYYTVGGVKYNAASGKPVKNQNKPAAKPEPKPAPAPKPAAVTSGGPAPASRPYSGGSAKVSSDNGPSTVSKIHTYKEHGSDLHVGRHKTLAEHRAAVEKAKGGGSTSTPSTPSQERTNDKAPNGQSYKGPAGGPDKKSSDNFTSNQVGYNPQNKVDGSKYEAGKAAKNRTGDNNPDVSSKATNKYLEEIKKKKAGQSNVIG